MNRDVWLALLYIAVFASINLIVAHVGPWVIPITTIAAVCVNMLIRDYLLYDGGLKWSASTCSVARLFLAVFTGFYPVTSIQNDGLQI